jgi:hypothetical protein
MPPDPAFRPLCRVPAQSQAAVRDLEMLCGVTAMAGGLVHEEDVEARGRTLTGHDEDDLERDRHLPQARKRAALPPIEDRERAVGLGGRGGLIRWAGMMV